MKVRQREIVEVPFTMPDGRVLVHPGLVVSSDELQEVEDVDNLPKMINDIINNKSTAYKYKGIVE